jgi:uncharacterized protein with PIN domain
MTGMDFQNDRGYIRDYRHSCERAGCGVLYPGNKRRPAVPNVRRVAIVIEPVTENLAYIARQAFHDYGKGRHPAGLNFGDCFAYSLAKHLGEPLLFKGRDFKKTDIPCAI